MGTMGQGLGRWCCVCVCCESGFSVLMAGPGKMVIGTHCGGREGSTQFAQGLPHRCDSFTACRPCRLEHEETLPHRTRRTLAQFKTNKSHFLKSYLHKSTPTHIRRSDGTTGQMIGEAGWWIPPLIGLRPLARVKGVSRQPHIQLYLTVVSLTFVL